MYNYARENYEKQIVQVMNDLFSAGMDTSRTALIWCLVMMMREPDVAQRVRKDLHKVVGASQMITLKHRSQLPEWKITNYTIPPGSHIIPLINKMNVDPELYPDPYKFEPERFIKKGQLQVLDTFAQFGIGQRLCLGTQLARMELFLFLANLMNQYEFYMPQGQQVPGLEGICGSIHSPVPFDLCFKRLEVLS
ncbi:Cytochrome P450 CYP18B3 [Operophtera brumata]|uniref:Cytochrome P450 CYP18B3 n=1 Tax=Operophtera brumata TaxID=104452 RepID=A0A0L7LCD9_OPEBR|nr:Cytochrome P450 CYP18B3 [Operophtera brumata]